ncbi:MAG: hypothetical protein HUU34_02440 [Saprospiraceae bacterium]|jgi:hypothetical protein|nr:hypothetical protein [Saprospiraceae bacterium]
MALTRVKNLQRLLLKIPRIKPSEDRTILLVCIGIALAFWLLVKLSQTYRVAREVDLTLHVPDGKTLAAAAPAALQAELEGTGWQLMFEYLMNARHNLVYEIRSEAETTLSRAKLEDDIQRNLVSNGLIVLDVNIDNIPLQLENKVLKKVPVVLNYRFSFAPEYELQREVVLTPDSITVSGPASQIKALQSWPSDSLILQALNDPVKRKVKLRKPPSGLEINHEEVEADVAVEQFTEKWLFVPLTVTHVSDSLKFFPDRVKLTCVVGLSRYNDLDPDDFTLLADLKDVSTSKGANTVPIVLARQPYYVRNVYFTPQSVEFFILK